jgi:hypothetical protein
MAQYMMCPLRSLTFQDPPRNLHLRGNPTPNAVYNDLFQEKSPIKLSDRSVNTDSAEAQSSNNELSQFFPVLHYTNSYFNRLQSTSDKAQLEKFQSFISVIKSSP